MLSTGCDAEWHTYCLLPPLTEIPEGTWYCATCKTGELDPEEVNEADDRQVEVEVEVEGIEDVDDGLSALVGDKKSAPDEQEEGGVDSQAVGLQVRALHSHCAHTELTLNSH